LFLALQRLYTFTGTVVVDDLVRVQEDSLQSVRDVFSYVPQDPILYQGTIRDNLIRGMTSLPSNRLLWTALERVSMDMKVREWPEQLETRIVSQGENLSAGERQLLCLARALLRRARILLVDEGMSSVDETTERLAHDTLLSLSGCTVLSICHNLGSLHRFDYVVVMDGGRVAEHGTPSLLMNGQGDQTGVILRELVRKS
jgi:ABC-type multidrug transport system fused ATPase/permease subunit